MDTPPSPRICNAIANLRLCVVALWAHRVSSGGQIGAPSYIMARCTRMTAALQIAEGRHSLPVAQPARCFFAGRPSPAGVRRALDASRFAYAIAQTAQKRLPTLVTRRQPPGTVLDPASPPDPSWQKYLHGFNLSPASATAKSGTRTRIARFASARPSRSTPCVPGKAQFRADA